MCVHTCMRRYIWAYGNEVCVCVCVCVCNIFRFDNGFITYFFKVVINLSLGVCEMISTGMLTSSIV